MSPESTLGLLYLTLAIAVLWVAAMLTWLLFEAALALRNANRIITSIQKKVTWLEETIKGIGQRLESSASYLGTAAKGGKAIASFLRERRGWDEDEEEEEQPRKKRKTKRRRR